MLGSLHHQVNAYHPPATTPAEPCFLMAGVLLDGAACSQAPEPAASTGPKMTRSAHRRERDDGGCVGVPAESARRRVARHVPAVRGNQARLQDVHEYAGRSAAARARQDVVQQLPHERRAAGKIAAARRRGRDVSRVQPARRAVCSALAIGSPTASCAARTPPAALAPGRAADAHVERSARDLRVPDWLARGAEWARIRRGAARTPSPPPSLIPVEKLDPRKGEAIYADRCVTCHGADGQGVEIGDKKAGPLWGPDSWNDGAGAARVYTLAGMIRYSMPYLDPGQHDRRGCAAAGRVHQFEAASRVFRSRTGTTASRNCRPTLCTTAAKR